MEKEKDIIKGFWELMMGIIEINFRWVGLRKVVRVKKRIGNGGFKIIEWNESEVIGVEDVGGVWIEDNMIIGVKREGLSSRDERWKNIREVGKNGMRGKNWKEIGDRERKKKREIEKWEDLMNEWEGRKWEWMEKGERRKRDEKIRKIEDWRIWMEIVDEVMKKDEEIGMDRGVKLRKGKERGNKDRKIVFKKKEKIMLKEIVGEM